MRNPSQIQVDSNVTVEEVLVQLKNILENRYQMQLPEVSFFLRFLCTQTSIETIFSGHLPADRSANFSPTHPTTQKKTFLTQLPCLFSFFFGLLGRSSPMLCNH